MQSYTTQTHQRNYQGNVILNTPSRRARHHQLWVSIVFSIMTLAVIVSSTLLGVMALHNQALKHQVASIITKSSATTNQQNCDDSVPCDANYIVSNNETTDNQPQHRDKTLRRIPISNQRHHTQPLPTIDGIYNDAIN